LVDEWDVKWLDMVQLNWIDYDLRWMFAIIIEEGYSLE
jgi:hypothetical protein